MAIYREALIAFILLRLQEISDSKVILKIRIVFKVLKTKTKYLLRIYKKCILSQIQLFRIFFSKYIVVNSNLGKKYNILNVDLALRFNKPHIFV